MNKIQIFGKSISILSALVLTFLIGSVGVLGFWALSWNKTQQYDIASQAGVTFSDTFNLPIAKDVTNSDQTDERVITMTVSDSVEHAFKLNCNISQVGLNPDCTPTPSEIELTCFRTDHGSGKISTTCTNTVNNIWANQQAISDKVYIDVKIFKLACLQTLKIGCSLV
jgi:hypothetical protein